MTFFRGFTFPLWQIFGGSLLLLLCSLFYLAWWAVSFRPHSSGGSAAAFYIAAAFITGCAAIGMMAGGINSLSEESRGLPVRYIIGGGIALFFVLLTVTSMVFHRVVTSELLIIHLWATLVLSAVAVLHGTGRFGAGHAVAMAALVAIFTVAALVCYVIYYDLDDTGRFYIGMAPLIADSVVMAVFLGMLAFS